jgi:hypothetical protein
MRHARAAGCGRDPRGRPRDGRRDGWLGPSDLTARLLPTAGVPGGVRRGRVPTTGISVTGEGVESNPLSTLPGRTPPPAATLIRSVAVPISRQVIASAMELDRSLTRPRRWGSRRRRSVLSMPRATTSAGSTCVGAGRGDEVWPPQGGASRRITGFDLQSVDRGGRRRRRRGHSFMQPSSASRRDRRNPTRPLAGHRGVARRYRRQKGSCPPPSRLAVHDGGMRGMSRVTVTLPHPGLRHLRGPELGLMVQASRSRRGPGAELAEIPPPGYRDFLRQFAGAPVTVRKRHPADRAGSSHRLADLLGPIDPDLRTGRCSRPRPDGSERDPGRE